MCPAGNGPIELTFSGWRLKPCATFWWITRALNAARRGGQERQAVPLEEAAVICAEPCKEILALDDALKILGTLSPRQSQVVELRYFGGLSNEEIAETLKISPETVVRDWRAAKA